MKNYFKKPIVLGIGFTMCIFLAYIIAESLIKDINTIKALLPIRNILFFPMLTLVENTWSIYCGIAKIGLLDFQRCVTPTGPGFNMPDGPPQWFGSLLFEISIAILAIYYILIFKIILTLVKKFNPSHNQIYDI